jgi:ParB family chromosome partitioning protein
MKRRRRARDNPPRDFHSAVHIADITIPEGGRKIDERVVKRLTESITQLGLRTPITLVRKPGVAGEYILIAGRHRIEAYKRLGKEHIPAAIVSFTEVQARLWTIAENLHRSELTVLYRSNLTREWTELVSDSSSEKKRTGRPGAAAAASRELGINEREVQRALKIASITPEAKQIAVDIGVDDNQSKLLKIAAEKTPTLQVAKANELAKPEPDDSEQESSKNHRTAYLRRANQAARFATVPYYGPVTQEIADAAYEAALAWSKLAISLEQRITPPAAKGMALPPGMPSDELIKAIADRADAKSKSTELN